MCGIGGVVVGPGEAFDTGWLDNMVGALAHRGPDDHGVMIWDPGSGAVAGRRSLEGAARAGLAHTRLSIIDLTTGGWQPMSSRDGRHHLVFNGEIYNYLELRNELVRCGRTFSSNSDTEVLLNAYQHWGTGCLDRLVGMFAFAVLDVEAHELVLARDSFGIKPLLYARWPGGLAFASEVNALLQLPKIPRRPNGSALFDYLEFGLTEHREQTLFETVRRLPPAHYLRVPLGNPQLGVPVQYWQPNRQRIDVSFPEAVATVREIFVENIGLHLRSDVPIGTALSGGIDSSSILGVMREIAGGDADIRSFSYIADEERINEERWVDLAAASSSAHVEKVRVSAHDLVRDLDTLVLHQGEPFGSTSIYAQQRVFRLARDGGVPVMLDGQGADELFGGYRSYLASRFASLVRKGRFVAAGRLVAGVTRMPDTNLDVQTLRQVAGYVVPERVKPVLRRMRGQESSSPWLNPEWFVRRGVSVRNRQSPKADVADALHAAFVNTSLPALLRYEDRNSMTYSIESRVPFLTPKFVDYVFSLPEEYLVGSDGLTKRVFREAMRGFVPDLILDRRDKVGFNTPELIWLSELGTWVQETLCSDAARQVHALRIPEVQRHWEDVLAGRRAFDWKVWRWINLIRWADLYGLDFDGG